MKYRRASQGGSRHAHTQKTIGDSSMHTSRLTAGLLAAAALLVPCAANAQSALGPYLFAGLGYDQMPDRNLVINGAARSSQWKPGYGLLAGVGYKWFFGLRTEA